MSDTNNNEQWPDRALTPAQAANRDAAALIPVTRSGAMPTDFAQMVDYAKFMSTAVGFVGGHLLKNVGACLGIMEVANQFGLPAYAVARQSYLVNGRVAFMGQFFHSVVEDYAPLERGANGRKLQFRYEGEGPTLKIIVSGTFKGAAEPVIYESPMFKDIPTKNSPLWKSPSPSDVKRQFIYYGVRGWQTINWPEGMLHAISEDEAAALPPSDYARDITPMAPTAEADGLRERLARAHVAHGDHPKDGFVGEVTDAHFTDVTEQTAGVSDAAIEQALAAAGGATADPEKHDDANPDGAPAARPAKPRAPRKKATEKPADVTPAAMMPTTPAEWVPYATAWLNAETDAEAMRKRWTSEQKMRNTIGVTSEERDPVFEVYQNRLAAIEGE